jgi:hypothetical protein
MADARSTASITEPKCGSLAEVPCEFTRMPLRARFRWAYRRSTRSLPTRRAAELRIEQHRRHKVPLARADALLEQVAAALEVDEPGVGSLGADRVAIGTAQRRAGDDEAGVGCRGQRLADEREPRPPVVVAQRDARGHLLDVADGVQRVCVDERNAENTRQQFAHGRLARTAHSHNDERRHPFTTHAGNASVTRSSLGASSIFGEPRRSFV